MVESSWRRAWRDTEHFRKSTKSFWGIEVVGAAVFGAGGTFGGWLLIPQKVNTTAQVAYPIIGGAVGIVLGFLIVFGIIFLVNSVRAPYKQRNEALKRVIELEKEREAKFAVKPIVGKRSNYGKNELTAWAELEISNTSPSVDLADVSVQIVDLMQVYEKEDDKGGRTGIYHLSEPYPKWSPANVYWSGRTGAPRQFNRPIHPHETQYATIAFHHENGTGLGVFNILNNIPMLESRIVIEVSSPSSNTWQGVYYIAYRPPKTDDFEFVEWDLWRKTHKVIEQSIPHKEGSQT